MGKWRTVEWDDGAGGRCMSSYIQGMGCCPPVYLPIPTNQESPKVGILECSPCDIWKTILPLHFSLSLCFFFYFCLSMSLFSVSLSLCLCLCLCVLSCSGSLSISGSLHLCLFLGKSHMAVRGSWVLGSGRVRPPCGCEGGASRALSICLRNPGEAGLGSTPTPTHWRFHWAPLSREALSLLSSGE